MSYESWRLSRYDLRDVMGKYERALEEDAIALLRPNAAEKALLGTEVFKRRAAAVKKARDTNREFLQALLDDLPDVCAGPEALEEPPRPVAQFRCYVDNPSFLPTSSYGSAASVFLHLLRDWSSHCEHVGTSTYGPAVNELCAALPDGGSVLLPGAGLGRLALDLAAKGYEVEANDASKIFLTVADFILNRAPAGGFPIFPMAHVYSENWSRDVQYMEVQVPQPTAAAVAEGAPRMPITMVPGDFAKTYGILAPGNRKFDAVVTCFFIDTVTDVVELFKILDSLLGEGGVWVNIGPLNWKKDARLKLCWEEVVAVWESMGYEFVTQKRAECDYHLRHGMKMYTESYCCSLTTAIKRCQQAD